MTGQVSSMEKNTFIKNRVISFVLMLVITVGILSDIIPGTAITAGAKTDYKVLLWSPSVCDNTNAWINAITDMFKTISGVNATVNTKQNVTALSQNMLNGVDMVYILPSTTKSDVSLLGNNKSNVGILKDFANSGGRIVMNGENANATAKFNEALSELASELGGNFTISTDSSHDSDAHEMNINIVGRPTLVKGCEKIYPQAYAHIQSTNTISAIWLMRDDNGNVLAMDQSVGRGYITAISDVNWYDLGSTGDQERKAQAIDAARKFLGNLLVDSSQHIETVSKPTIAGPQNLQWEEGDNTKRTISVSASAANGGTLSYQWHKGTSASFTPENSNKINGATSASYTIPSPESMAVGNYYYKCVVTNTTNLLSASTTSKASTVTVKQKNPVKPVITGPQNLEWEEGDKTQRILSVTATITDGGTLSYQWYKGTSAGFTPGGTNIINGATGASYTIPSPETMAAGSYYFKCVVINTLGTVKASEASGVATVTIKALSSEEPEIKGPGNLEWDEGDTTNRKLSVTAIVKNPGTLTYQWYRGTSADFEPSATNMINGETASDYTIPSPGTMAVGTYFYKCVVTNTRGTAIASATSNVATVTVKPIQSDPEPDPIPDPPKEPKKPVIMGPQDLEWFEGDGTLRVLSVNAMTDDEGKLSYQWYEGDFPNFEPGNENKINGATGSNYLIPVPGNMGIGEYYYKCVVTNTIDSGSSYSVSDLATVTVKPLMPGQPVINGPQDLEWYIGDNLQRRLMVIARAENDGTMTYQWYKGTSESFEPVDSNKISGATRATYNIPSPGKMAVGQYYYKCVVTNTKNGYNMTTTSEAAIVTVKPRETLPVYDPGTMEVDIEKKEDTPDIAVSGLTEEIAWAVASDEEKKEISKGVDGKLTLEITNINDTVAADDRQKVEQEAKVLNDASAGMYLDFSMFFQLANGYKRKLSDLNGKSIKATVTVPANLLTTEKKRTFYLVSVHNGVLRIHGSSQSDKINATIYDFSTYAIIYSDEDEPVLQANIKIEQTHDKIIVRWDKIRDVGKVDLFLQDWGKKYSKKPTKTNKSRKVAMTTLKGKKINQTRNYKMYLVAYDSSSKRIGKTLSCHFAGKLNKYTNPKKPKLSTKQLKVAVGQSARIKASIKYEDPKKKALSTKHAPRYRYVSDVPEIAAVDKKGNITGLSPGTCDVYVCCQNGMSKHVSVTVTE